MKKSKSIILYIQLLIFLLSACKEKETPTVNQNVDASLRSIEFEYNGSIFNTQISGNTIMLERLLPYGTESITIKGISLGENCSSILKVGDKMSVSNNGTSIIVTNNSSKKTATYQVQLSTRNYSSVVDKYGLLQTSGNKIVDKNKNPVSLAASQIASASMKSFLYFKNLWRWETCVKILKEDNCFGSVGL